MKFPTFLFLSIAFAIAPLAHGDETPYVVSAEDARYACVKTRHNYGNAFHWLLIVGDITDRKALSAYAMNVARHPIGGARFMLAHPKVCIKRIGPPRA